MRNVQKKKNRPAMIGKCFVHVREKSLRETRSMGKVDKKKKNEQLPAKAGKGGRRRQTAQKGVRPRSHLQQDYRSFSKKKATKVEPTLPQQNKPGLIGKDRSI